MTQRLDIRPAQPTDCRLLFDWANETGVRAMSFSSQPIDWETHQAWFTAKLADPAAHLFVALNRDSQPVGLVRFERDEKSRVEIGISLAVEQRGQGLGAQIVTLGCEALRSVLGPVEIVARCKVENEAAILLFERCGFERTGTDVVHGCQAVVFQSRFSPDTDSR